MRLTTYPTASAFLDAVRPALGEHEAEHHMLLGVAEGAAGGSTDVDGLFAASVVDANGLALAALMTRDRPLLMASDREDVGSAAGLLWDEISRLDRQPQFAIGGADWAPVAVREWERLHGRDATIAMRQRVYRLTAVAPQSPTSGVLRLAAMDDLDLVTEWTQAFQLEALPAVRSESSRASAHRRISAGDLYLWCDPDPRTMAGSARPTKRAIAVNGVYTPPEWRRRGYATACVAALSTHLLERFEFCVLYTDLANPTSNSIYTQLGYRRVRDFLMYALPSTPD
jgi:GNAT superfamily N-acetyltransferase